MNPGGIATSVEGRAKVHSGGRSFDNGSSSFKADQNETADLDGQQLPSPATCNNIADDETRGSNGGDLCGHQITDVDGGATSEDECVDSIVLDCGGGAKPWPKWKRFPKDAPDSVPPSLMGAIERALRNSATRKTEHIFEPAIGMTFDCITYY